jgi:glycosyltransferase involved in cell wall biosynthesis
MQELLTSYIEFGRQLSIWEIVLLSFIAGIYLIRFLYDLFIYGRLLFKSDFKIENSRPSFSILMIARNEEDNIRNNLPKILSSDYDDFEVVVVDDFSQDQTYTLLGLLREENKKLRISSLNQETRHSSKQALNIGFKAAKNDWVFISKPSVTEFQQGWLLSFAEKLESGKNLVVGYSNILEQEGTYNLLFRIESFLQQIQSFAYIKAGCGFIVEEDSLCFPRQKYFDMGGFAGEMNEEYANLELLVNKFIKKKQTSVNLSPEGIVRKKRFITAKKFRELNDKAVRIIHKLGFKRRFLLFIDDITSILILPLTFVLAIIFPEILIVSGLVLFMKLILHIVIINKAANRLNEQKIFLSSLLYELIIPYYKLFVRWSYYRSLRKSRWSNS